MWRFLKVGLDGGLIAFRFVLFATLEVDLLLWPPEFEHSLRAPTQNSSFQHSSSSKAIGNFVMSSQDTSWTDMDYFLRYFSCKFWENNLNETYGSPQIVVSDVFSFITSIAR